MRKTLLVLLLLLASNLFSQNQEEQEYEIVAHRVMMGETVRMLSKKYLVPPSEIYRLNKFAVDGISQGMVLKIPVPVKNKPIPEEAVAQSETPPVETPSADTAAAPTEPYVNSTTTHRVQSGETLLALAQQYGVTVKALKQANPKVAKRGLRADEVILIPSVTVSDDYVNEIVTALPGKADPDLQTSVPTPADGSPIPKGETIEHTVKPGETLFGLAKKYNVSPDVIKSQNARILARGLQVGQVIKIRPE